MIEDVPSPVDLRLMPDAVAWEASALAKRPCRPQFFSAFSDAVGALSTPSVRILELGSGPGFLAMRLLEDHPGISYVALDFSPAVHELRHKRRALALHRAVKQLLTAGGAYLVCDHFCGPGGQTNDQLYMSVQEHRACLLQAGFGRVEVLLETGGLVLHAATRIFETRSLVESSP